MSMLNNCYEDIKREYYIVVALFMVAIPLLLLLLGFQFWIVLQRGYVGLFSIISIFVTSFVVSYILINKIDVYRTAKLRWRWIRSLKSAYEYLSMNHRLVKSFLIGYEYESEDLRNDVSNLMQSTTREQFLERSKAITDGIVNGDYEDETTLLYQMLINIEFIEKYYDDKFLEKTSFLHK